MNKKELGQIIVHIHKGEISISLFYRVVAKLKKIGYQIDKEDIEDVLDDGPYNFFFICIDKDKKDCFLFNSIVGPACMASSKLRPISIKWMDKKFDWIMSDKTTASDLQNLEKKAYKAIKK